MKTVLTRFFNVSTEAKYNLLLEMALVNLQSSYSKIELSNAFNILVFIINIHQANNDHMLMVFLGMVVI